MDDAKKILGDVLVVIGQKIALIGEALIAGGKDVANKGHDLRGDSDVAIASKERHRKNIVNTNLYHR